ncbi:hypothetical protein ACFOVU_04755 [Nocardiopsis sediminis]|uniref:Uncharacterized protein n=1 Tax=Nocardiopsis sediminis TaxID=1778267 RepID=A0ABV8FGG0_9ACTN
MNHRKEERRPGRKSGIGINYGVTAGSITGPVQNNPFAHGGVQINHAAHAPVQEPDRAALIRSALIGADTVRHQLIPLAEAGDRDALLAINDLAQVTARLTPSAALAPVAGDAVDGAALGADFARFTNRCAVLSEQPAGLPALRSAVSPLTAD